MKIIDTFIFYNELEILYYRLSTLYNYVDTFVLVEATLTFKGNPKPLYYAENKERFKMFANKIVHVVVQDLIPNAKYDANHLFQDDVWKNERYQRNCIDCGIQTLQLSDHDFIMVSDVDEIPNMVQLMQVVYIVSCMSNHEKNGLALSLEQDMYYYNLTSKQQTRW